VAVFRNAATFRLHGKTDKTQASKEFGAYDKALEQAHLLIAHGVRILLYVVSKDERFFCIPPKQWDQYLQIWRETHEEKAND
jgi:hypothetical protein